MDRRKQERPEAQVITPELLAKIAERAKEIERGGLMERSRKRLGIV